MARLPDHFTRRPDNRAGDLCEAEFEQADAYTRNLSDRARFWRWSFAALALCWAVVGAVVWGWL